MTTSWPALVRDVAKAVPTLPAPMMATFMMVLLAGSSVPRWGVGAHRRSW
jgi:hypothetical protein